MIEKMETSPAQLTRFQRRVLTWLQTQRHRDPSYIGAIIGEWPLLLGNLTVLLVGIWCVGLDDLVTSALLIGIFIGACSSFAALFSRRVKIFRTYKLVIDWEKADALLQSAGTVNRKISATWLLLIGLAGLTYFTFHTIATNFPVPIPKDRMEQLRSSLAQSTINMAVPSIEMYKLTNGRYPDSLKELEDSVPKGIYVGLHEPSVPLPGQSQKSGQYFFYERVGQDHYYLRSVGPDGLPFTTDDIVPQIAVGPKSKVGLLVQRVKQ